MLSDKLPQREKSGLKYGAGSYDKNVQGESEAAPVDGFPSPDQVLGYMVPDLLVINF